MTTKKDIENALMRGADTLRDTIDAANYKDYVLPIMFVKYLSDSYEDALDELKKHFAEAGEDMVLTSPFYCDHGDKTISALYHCGRVLLPVSL